MWDLEKWLLFPSPRIPRLGPSPIEEIAQKLRQEAGLPKKPTGEVANK